MNIEQTSSKDFAEILGIKTRQMAALVVTGYRFYQQGQTHDAAKIFEGIAVLESHNPYVHGILGSIYQKLEQYDAAIIRYNNALTIFPDDVNSLTNRGEILIKLGRFPEAAQDLKRAIQVDPERKNPAANRARLLVALVQDEIALSKQGKDALEEIRKQVESK